VEVFLSESRRRIDADNGLQSNLFAYRSFSASKQCKTERPILRNFLWYKKAPAALLSGRRFAPF